MRAGMDLLLALIRDEDLPPNLPSSSWQSALTLAQVESVQPYLIAQIRKKDPSLPESIRQELDQLERQLAISTFWWTSELKGILAAFHDDAIPVIPLKGPFLAHRIYGDARLRTCRDLDLLVSRSNLRSAGSLLRRRGFRLMSRPDDYHEAWLRGTTLVELHHNVENPLAFRFDIAAAWRRAETTNFVDLPVLHFAPQDELLLLALHGVRHRFERLSQTLDLALAFERLSPQIPPMAYRSDLPTPLRPLLVLAAAMTANLLPQSKAPIDAEPFCESPQIQNHMNSLAQQLWHASLTQIATPLDWRSQHRFYLQTETTLYGRLCRSIRHLLILSTRLIQEDFDFAARHRIRWPLLVWVVRQARLFLRIFRNHRSPSPQDL
jgi:hypothetical protein